MLAAVPSLLDYSSVKDLMTLGSALPSTSSLLHYQLTAILDGVKLMACYNSSAAFSMISRGLCNYAGFKVSLYKGTFEMAGGIKYNFPRKLDETKLTLHP